MKKRLLTGAVILLLTALAVASRLVTIYFFDFFVMAISFVATYEMIRANLVEEAKLNLTVKNTAYVYIPLIYCYLVYMCYAVAKSVTEAMLFQLLVFAVLILASVITELVYLKKCRDAEFDLPTDQLFRSTKISAKIMLYPVTLIASLYGFGLNGMGTMFGLMIVVLIFLVSMGTDVFAYCIGMSFHKGIFASQISPKKSISGAIGGILGGIINSALVCIICYFLLKDNPFEAFGLAKTITFFAFSGVLGSCFVEAGDLFASAIKRRVGIKDFGKMFPGHGGMMDRIDGLCFASFVIFVLTAVIFLV